MAYSVSATEARIHFGELMERVAVQEETVVVERGGKPRVVLLSVREYDRLVAMERREGDWLSLADQARRHIREELGDRQLPPPEELIHQMREERDDQLIHMH